MTRNSRAPIWVFAHDDHQFISLCGDMHGQLYDMCDEALDQYDLRVPMSVGDKVDYRYPLENDGSAFVGTPPWWVKRQPILEPLRYVSVVLEHVMLPGWRVDMRCKFIPEVPIWIWQGSEYVKWIDVEKCKEALVGHLHKTIYDTTLTTSPRIARRA